MKNVKTPQDLPTTSANDEASLPGEQAGPGPDKLLTTKEVADWLGIQKCTLEKARSTRVGHYPPYIEIGRLIRYRRRDVEQWLDCRTRKGDDSLDLPTAA